MAFGDDFSGQQTFSGERRGSHVDNGLNTGSGRRGSHIEQIPVDNNTLHPSDNIIRRASVTNPDFGGLQADSKDATLFETEMGVWEAIRLYKKAMAWSVLLSTAIIMEGYDVVLLGNFYALPQFLHRYGNEIDPKTSLPTVSAAWRSGLSNGALVGEILGLMATGICQDRFGYKKTIGVALVGVVCFIFLTFFAVDIGMLMAGEVLCGLCWGVFQTITTAYASEVTPVALRAYLTTYVNLCWVFGQLVGSGVLRGMLLRTDEWAYRIPFALQWMWPIPILIGCILCPESPWWLVRHGRYEEAKHSLRRLTTAGNANFDLDKTVAMMEHTNELEREMSSGTSYLDCFKGVDLRRTEITCATWMVQTICGSTFMGYSTVFYEQAGLAVTNAFDLSMAQYGLGSIGTMGSWFLMGFAGRRTIYLYGSCVLCLLLIIIGFLGLAQNNHSAQWAIGSMLLIFTFIYDLTVGPVCYSLVAEIPSTRLKAKTIVLSRNFYNIGGIVVNVLTNYMLTPTAWNWGAYSGFFWAGTCFLCVVWIFFRLPEPKGRTYGELDILFEHRVSARKFKGTVCFHLRALTAVFTELTIVVRTSTFSGATPSPLLSLARAEMHHMTLRRWARHNSMRPSTRCSL